MQRSCLAPASGWGEASQKHEISGAGAFQIEDLKEISVSILGMWSPCLYAPLYTHSGGRGPGIPLPKGLKPLSGPVQACGLDLS